MDRSWSLGAHVRAPLEVHIRCKFIDRCPVFPLFESKQILRIYQINYCESRYETCARFELASAGTVPDPRLLPDGAMVPE